MASVGSLITGGSGFIGRHLCRRLCAAVQSVHATSRRPHASLQSGPVWHEADLADLAAARGLFAALKPDVVYHLAGAVGANPDLRLVIPTFQSLLASTVNVLIPATEAGCQRIVLVGSLTEPQAPDGAAAPYSPPPRNGQLRDMAACFISFMARALWRAGCHPAPIHDLWPCPGGVKAHSFGHPIPCCAGSNPSSQAAGPVLIGSISRM